MLTRQMTKIEYEIAVATSCLAPSNIMLNFQCYQFGHKF